MSHQEVEALRKEVHDLTEVLTAHMKSMKPMLDAYKTANRLGKWAMRLFAFISLGTAALLGLKELFQR